MKRLRSMTEDIRQKFIAEKEAALASGKYSQIDYTSDDDSNSKAYSKIPAMKDLEPAVTELLAAHQMRNERQSKFEEPFIDENDIPEYAGYIKQEILHRLRAMPYQAYEVGKLLRILKKHLPHGKFYDWVLKNLPISKATALNFMRVYRICLGHPEIIEYFKRSVLYKICAPSFPEDFRKFIFENITGPFDVKNKDLLQVAVKWEKKEVNPKSPEVQSLLKEYKLRSDADKYIYELKKLAKVLKNSAKKIDALNQINDPHPFLSDNDNMKDKRFYEIGELISGFLVDIDLRIKNLSPDQ